MWVIKSKDGFFMNCDGDLEEELSEAERFDSYSEAILRLSEEDWDKESLDQNEPRPVRLRKKERKPDAWNLMLDGQVHGSYFKEEHVIGDAGILRRQGRRDVEIIPLYRKREVKK